MKPIKIIPIELLYVDICPRHHIKTYSSHNQKIHFENNCYRSPVLPCFFNHESNGLSQILGETIASSGKIYMHEALGHILCKRLALNCLCLRSYTLFKQTSILHKLNSLPLFTVSPTHRSLKVIIYCISSSVFFTLPLTLVISNI